MMTDREAYIHFVTQILCREKAMMPRAYLLRLGDEAAGRLAAIQGSPALTEEALLQEFDRLLLKQLRVLPLTEWMRERRASEAGG